MRVCTHQEFLLIPTPGTQEPQELQKLQDRSTQDVWQSYKCEFPLRGGVDGALSPYVISQG